MPTESGSGERPLAIVNARVWTNDPRRPWADAVLVVGSTIASVGSSAEVRKRIGSETDVVDAAGNTVVPHGGGMLRAGMPADLALLDSNLPRVTPDAVREAGVVLALRAGAAVP